MLMIPDDHYDKVFVWQRTCRLFFIVERLNLSSDLTLQLAESVLWCKLYELDELEHIDLVT